MRLYVSNNYKKDLYNTLDFTFTVILYDNYNLPVPTNKWEFRGVLYPPDGVQSVTETGQHNTVKYIKVKLKSINTSTSPKEIVVTDVPFVYSPAPSSYEYYHADLVMTQLGRGSVPFALDYTEVTVDHRMQVVKIPYIKYTTLEPTITLVDHQSEYHLEYDPWEDSVYFAGNNLIVECAANMSNKFYHQHFKLSYGDYEVLVTVNQTANPNAIFFTLYEAETNIIPYSATPENNTYNITIIANSNTGVSTEFRSYDSGILLNNSASITSKEQVGNNTKYVITVRQQADSNNLTSNKREEDYYLILRDASNNELIIERIKYTQEPYATLYVSDDIELDYTYYNFYNVQLEGNILSTMTIASIDKPSWISNITLDIANKALVLSGITQNDEEVDRTATINITLNTGTEFKPTTNLSFNIKQVLRPIPIAESSWKKHYVNITEEIPYFSLVINGERVYTGRNTEQPIEISDIVRDYVITPNLDFSSLHTSQDPITVEVYAYLNDTQFAYRHETYNVLWDYSYEQNLTPQDFMLTSIYQSCNVIDPRQYIPCSVRNFNKASLEPKIYEFNSDGLLINTIDITVEPDIERVYTALLTPNINTAKVEFSDQSIAAPIYYDVKCTNADYCMYYLNPSGGWSWMLFEGANIEKANFKRETYLSNVDNRNTTESSKNVYLTKINKSWTLKTGYMKDKESKNFKYLIASPKCYLHDLNNNNIYAVNITTNSVDVKSFRTNGRKFSTYSVNVDYAQDIFVNS